MCGIFGSRRQLENLDTEGICRSLRHRGPDAQNFRTYHDWTFFHSRLAIIDLEGGKQPFESARLLLVFNGEIYNHQDLARQHALPTREKSDTEVVALLYEKLGVDVFSQLNGMFAIAIFDKRSDQLILARDRAGKKPLYWADSPSLTFASEYQALFHAGVSKRSCPVGLIQQLRYGFARDERTVYAEIHELRPGHFYVFSEDGKLTQRTRFWDFEQSLRETGDTAARINSTAAAVATIDAGLRRAVHRRITSSDLEVGAFLSGGIDSSLICAYAAEISPGLRTFTVKTDERLDESAVAGQIAAKLGLRNQTLPLDTANLADRYLDILLAYGEPICDESIIPSFLVAEAAKRHVTVVLTGDGGDEVFAGYRRHVYYRYEPYFQALGPFWNLARTGLGFFRQPTRQGNQIERISRAISAPEQLKYWPLTSDLFYAAPATTEFRQPSELADAEFADFRFHSLEDGIALDFSGILPKILLKKIDIATMRHALEARCPLLDFELIQAANRLARSQKVTLRSTKKILRELAKRKVGPEFSRLPKKGFEIDVEKLITVRLRDLVQHYLYSSHRFVDTIFDPGWLQANYLTPGKLNPKRRYQGLFALLNLEIWHQHR